MSIQKKLGTLQIGLAGFMLASTIFNATPINRKTIAVAEARADIEKQLSEMGTSETIFRGEEGNRATFTIVGNELREVATEHPQMNYSEDGLPISEKVRNSPADAVFSGALGLSALGLGLANLLKKKDEKEI